MVYVFLWGVMSLRVVLLPSPANHASRSSIATRQRRRKQPDNLGSRNLAALVGDGTGGGDCQGSTAGQIAAAVVETAGIDTQAAVTGDQALEVGQGAVQGNDQSRFAAERTAAVVQAAAIECCGTRLAE